MEEQEVSNYFTVMRSFLSPDWSDSSVFTEALDTLMDFFPIKLPWDVGGEFCDKENRNWNLAPNFDVNKLINTFQPSSWLNFINMEMKLPREIKY